MKVSLSSKEVPSRKSMHSKRSWSFDLCFAQYFENMLYFFSSALLLADNLGIEVLQEDSFEGGSTTAFSISVSEEGFLGINGFFFWPELAVKDSSAVCRVV